LRPRLDYDRIAPAGAKALAAVHGYVMRSGLDPVLVELVYLRVSQINGCAYCLDLHTRTLLEKGQKIEKLALVQAFAEAGDVFDARSKPWLGYYNQRRPHSALREESPMTGFRRLRREQRAGSDTYSQVAPSPSAAPKTEQTSVFTMFFKQSSTAEALVDSHRGNASISETPRATHLLSSFLRSETYGSQDCSRHAANSLF